MTRRAWALLVPALLAGCTAAREIVVSANDGKPLRPGDTAATRVADNLAILEVAAGRLRPLGTVAVPASMTGPPESVKLTANGRYAVVTAGQRIAAKTATTIVPDDAVTLVDLSRPARPRAVESEHAGAGATGVAIGARDTLVLVANRLADSVSVFGLAGGRLVRRADVVLPAGAHPVAARFTRDGSGALVVSSAGRLLWLDVAGGEARATTRSIALGEGAGGIALSPDGRAAYVGVTAPGADGRPAAAVATVDVGRFRVVSVVPVGRGIEGLALSPRGGWLAVTLLNGTNLPPEDPAHGERGALALLRVTAHGLLPAGAAETGRLCQGAAWSRDERRVFLQCAEPRHIETFRRVGARLIPDDAAPLAVSGRPGAMAGTRTR